MKADPILEEVWRIKDKLSQEMSAGGFAFTADWIACSRQEAN